MSDQLSIILLAAGPGAMIGLLSLGLITVYRSSGVLNLAQPAMATFGGYVYYELAQPYRLVPAAAMVVAALVTGLLSVLIYLLVMRPLQKTSPLTKLVASIGVTQVIIGALMWRYGQDFYTVQTLLPQGPVFLPFDVVIGIDRLLLIIIAVVVTAILWAVYRYSRFGVATSAVAESPFFASVYGLGTVRLAISNWFVGGLLAGAAGAILAPVIGLSLIQLSDLIVPILAAALIGSLTSFPLALFGGVLIAVLQAEVSNVSSSPGSVALVPFVVLLVFMMIRGPGAAIRNFAAPRLPAIGSGRIRWIIFATLIAALVVSTYTWLPDSLYRPVLSNVAVAIVLLSVVVITGYAGQLSLVQFALAGFAAFCAAHAASNFGLPFVPALVIGVLCSTLLGALLAVPALRMKGVNLAVITLGLSVVIYSGVLNSAEGIDVAAPTLLGVDLSFITSPRNYLTFTIAMFVLTVIVVSNLRRSPTGLRMIAIRGNERAASSLGINVAWVKTVAFALASGIAGLGGVLLAFQSSTTISFDNFTTSMSLDVVAWATIGGIGFLVGPVVGSFLFPGSLATTAGTAIYDNTAVLAFVGGVLLVLTLINHPDGVASLGEQIRHAVSGRRKAKAASTGETFRPELPAPAAASKAVQSEAPRAGSTLHVSEVTVTFGGVHALTNVTFDVRPGTVHGLIGSNGAGKTTLLDVVSGFTSPKSGEVLLGDVDLSHLPSWRRARLGFGRSFQNGQLLPDLTVSDNLRLAGAAAGGSVVRDLVAPARFPLTTTAQAAVQTLQLEGDLNSHIESLTHGKRQLVSIARALATAPSFVLLDEPAAGLDDLERQELGELLRRLAAELNIGILLVEHDVQLVLRVCDVVTVLHNGFVIAEGDPEFIRGSALVREAYLGEQEHEEARVQATEPLEVI